MRRPSGQDGSDPPVAHGLGVPHLGVEAEEDEMVRLRKLVERRPERKAPAGSS